MFDQNGQEKQTNKPTGGNNIQKCISCDVKNCHYHDPSNYCTANQINVGPTSAATSAETICATFKPKAE